MPKIIYILSQHHSGSTLLDLALSAHPRLCGLGETAMLMRPETRKHYLEETSDVYCFCGQTLTGCPLWSKFLAEAPQRDGQGLLAHYAELIRLVQAQYGPDTVLVDSSKDLPLLETLLEAADSGQLGGTEVFVVHLVKDGRSFSASMKRRKHRRDGRAADPARLYRYMGRWRRGVRKQAAWLEQRAVPHIRLGYEELCFDPAGMLETICEAAGVDFDPRMPDLRQAEGHTGVGNPMRSDQTRARAIRYDSRWVLDFWINLLYLMRPRVRRTNAAMVYQHSHKR